MGLEMPYFQLLPVRIHVGGREGMRQLDGFSKVRPGEKNGIRPVVLQRNQQQDCSVQKSSIIAYEGSDPSEMLR